MPPETPAAPTPDAPAPGAPPVAPPPPPNPAAKAAPKGDKIDQALAAAQAELDAAAAPPKPKNPAAVLEDLDALADPKDPLWKGDHTGLPPAAEIMAILPEPAAKLLANMRADYSRKTAEAAERIKTAEAGNAAVRAEIAELREQLAMFDSPAFKAHLEGMQKAGETADPFSPEGRTAAEQARFAALFAKALEPVQAEARKVAEAAQADARKASYNAYVAANPDLKTPAVKAGVLEILRAPGNEHLNLEQAHRLYVGSRAIEEAAKLRGESDEDRARRAAGLALTGGGNPAAQGTTKKNFKTWEESLAYHQAQGLK